MIITKIKRARGRHQRYSIFIDGLLTLELSDWTIGKFGLRTNDDLDDKTIEKIKSTEAETQAKNIAINYLSYRQRSSKEVLDHLNKKGFTRDCSANVVSNLQTIKMINDLEFAYSFVRDKLKRKPIGQALLRQKLHVKGIPTKTIDRIFSELISPQNQQTAALQAAKRKIQLARFSSKTDVEKQKKRLLDFLLRRGFSYEIALKTVRTTMDS